MASLRAQPWADPERVLVAWHGHRLVDRVELWKAAADAFLRRLNLVSR